MLHPVLATILKRLGLGVVTLFLVSIVIFTSVELLPGTYASAILGENATPEAVAILNKQLGLDRPGVVRYLDWVGNAMRGDFGSSFSGGAGQERPVSSLIGQRLRHTLFLASLSALVVIPLAIGFGLFTALHRNRWLDRLISGASLATISFPEFFIAYLLIFAVVMRDSFEMTSLAQVLPASVGHAISFILKLVPNFPTLANVSAESPFWERVWACSLPTLTLTIVIFAYVMRMTRAAIVDLLAQPYIEMARLNGEPPAAVILRHALPNAWAPIANVIAFTLAYLISGVVVVEVIFAYPGIGQLMVDAVRTRDIPVVQACSLIFAATYVVFNLCADIVSIVTNPRVLHPK